MKIKRFHGKTMHEAIRMVREEQGPDAVILSNRRIPGGVEVVSAVDYDAALMQQTLRIRDGAVEGASPSIQAVIDAAPISKAAPKPAPKPAAEPETLQAQEAAPPKVVQKAPEKSPDRRIEAALTQTLSAIAANPPKPVSPLLAKSTPVAAAHKAAVAVATSKPAASPELAQMRQELSSMRQFFEEQFAGMRWNDMQRLRPGQAAAVRMLADLGIEPELARSIAEDMPEATDAAKARYLPLGFLARRLPVDASDPVMQGGVFALVGPTGAGKTTSIAKLAGRFVAQHSARDIALVTTDHYRIGATEQIYNYGRLLGVPVHTLGLRDDLGAVLERLSDRRLVLVDTAGLGSRDALLKAQIARLGAVGSKLKSYLVLAANVDIASQKEIVRTFSTLPLAGCIVTKIDEADRVGAALSIGLRNKLAFTYFTDGQRVPEDLHVAAADRLVLRATQLARSSAEPLDEGVLARGLTSTVSHAHV